MVFKEWWKKECASLKEKKNLWEAACEPMYDS